MNQSPLQERGFFQSLFDLHFTSFITLRFLRVIYLVAMVFIALGAVGIVLAGASQGGSGLVLGIAFAAAFGLLYLIVTRIFLELVALFFRISENTATTADTLSRLVREEDLPEPEAAPAPHAAPAAPTVVVAAPAPPAPTYTQPVAPPVAPPAPPSPVYAPPPPAAPVTPTYAPPAPPPPPPPTQQLPPNPYGLKPPTQ